MSEQGIPNARGRPILGSHTKAPDRPGSPNAQSQAPSSTFTLRATAAEFVPKAPPKYIFNQTTAVEKMKHAIDIITSEPAEFDSILPCIRNSLVPSITQISDLQDVVELIVEQAIIESNFRYSAARLCNNFSNDLDFDCQGQSFRQLLLNRCQSEHMIKEKLSPKRLYGLALFLGELLVNMEVRKNQSGETEKVRILVRPIMDLLKLLIQTKGENAPDCMKCAIQVIKLTGAIMDDIGDVSDLNKIFEIIKDIILNDETPRNIKAMQLNLIETRAANWGRNANQESANLVTMPISHHQSSNSNQSTFQVQPQHAMIPQQPYLEHPAYNGVVYDMSELHIDGGDACYEAAAAAYDYFMIQGGPEGDFQPSEDEEFDDEIAAAYEQFMAETSEIKHNNP